MIKLNNFKIKIQLDILITYIILLAIITLTYIGSSYIVRRINTAEKQVAELKQKPSLYPDYDVIKGEHPDPKIKPIRFTENCPVEVCSNKKPATIDFDGIKKTYLVKGKFSRAYLYIEAAVDNERPLTSYDDIYFRFNNWGGHLLTSENLLPVPPSDISRYLYNLQSISYSLRGNVRPNRFENVNFFVFLQNGVTFDIHITISSDRPGRVLKEASIYYQCFENSECSIEELK